MNRTTIELEHIERFYPLAKGQFFYVLRDVNLKIEEGDFVSIKKGEGVRDRGKEPELSINTSLRNRATSGS